MTIGKNLKEAQKELEETSDKSNSDFEDEEIIGIFLFFDSFLLDDGKERKVDKEWLDEDQIYEKVGSLGMFCFIV